MKRLSKGMRLGSYRVVGFLASGGMGEVYKARHDDLGRWVAIKILPEEVGRDALAVLRFRRGARAASRLSHPNICTVFDFGEQDGYQYLVLEYLEGETLAERLSRRTRLGTEEVLRLATEVSDALLHAHEHGLLHRDLKPANIMLTKQGAKVLDFGLVKPMSGEELGTEVTTATDLQTVGGVIVGTAPYLAPEQIEGAAADARTDIYALGVVLYEALTGRRPFRGSTVSSLVASILAGSPPAIGSLAQDAPPALVRSVERCMARDPQNRWQTARDLTAELRWISGSGGDTALPQQSSSRRRARPALYALLAGAAVVVAVIVISVRGYQATEPRVDRVVAFDLSPPPGVSLREGPDSSAAISPDGETVVFVGSDSDGVAGLWTRSLDGREVRRLTSGPAGLPFWSPDGRFVGFVAGSELKVVRRFGGPPETLAAVSTEFRGASWGPRGIVFAPGPRGGLSLLSVDDRTTTQLTTPDEASGEIGHLWPHFLPDGNELAYFVASNEAAVRGLYLASLDRPVGRRMQATTASSVYASGHILNVSGTTLLARPFDPEDRAFIGDPVSIAEGVAAFFTFQSVVSASTNGVLAYSREATTEPTELRWADRTGAALDTTGPPHEQRNPSLSRDGRLLAVESHAGTDSDIVIVELDTGRRRRITDSRNQAMFPILSPDGSSLLFTLERGGGSDVYRVETHSAEPAEVVLSSNASLQATDWSAAGDLVLLAERTARGDFDILALPLDGGSPVRLMDAPHHEANGRLSPSGGRIAYISNESGAFEVYVEPYPRSGRKCLVSAGGGYDPHWGTTDDQIFYLSPAGTLMVVAVEKLDSCGLSRPREMFDARVKLPPAARNHFEVGPDGRFLLNSSIPGQGMGEIAVIVNWPAIAKERSR